MNRDDVITTLRSHKAEIHAFGVSHLHLYGSYARDEAGPESDIDLFFDKDTKRKFGFLEFTGLKIMLEELFGAEVGIVSRSSIKPALRHRIEDSAIKVF